MKYRLLSAELPGVANRVDRTLLVKDHPDVKQVDEPLKIYLQWAFYCAMETEGLLLLMPYKGLC